MKGRNTIMGWGEVQGDYVYNPTGANGHRHTRKVAWRPCDRPIPLPERRWVTAKRLTDFSGPKAIWWVRQAFWRMDQTELPPQPNGQVNPPPYTIDHACEDLFLSRDRFERLLRLIGTRKNLILQGPPGTGKTFIARRIAWCLIGFRDQNPIEMVQFHQSYAYEDFVQGYRPTDEGGFELRDGIFHRFCERARAKPGTPHIFIIDEINRGNLSRIFGELLMLIEADKRSEDYAVALTYAGESKERFHVPENVHILGMMNTADRSLALVDYALRRRFAFETLKPAYARSEFRDFLQKKKNTDSELIDRITKRMVALNKKIKTDLELGPGFEIGHSYFVPTDDGKPTEEWYDEVVESQIEPLLREYWFDSPKDVEKAVSALKAPASS